MQQSECTWRDEGLWRRVLVQWSVMECGVDDPSESRQVVERASARREVLLRRNASVERDALRNRCQRVRTRDRLQSLTIHCICIDSSVEAMSYDAQDNIGQK